MVSCSDDNELMFKNLCGYLCVRLHGEVSVASLSLRGNRDEPLAGKRLTNRRDDLRSVEHPRHRFVVVRKVDVAHAGA